MGKRVALVLLGTAAAVVVWLLTSPARTPVVAPPGEVAPPAEQPVAMSTPPADAGLEAPLSAPAPEPVTFQDGFCSQTGAESFEVRFTLERLLVAELHRRRADGGADQPDTQLLLDAARKGAGLQLELARQAAAQSPESPYLQVAVALAADAAGQADERLAALRRARQLLPADPAIAMALAQSTRDSGDLDEAIDGLSVYLTKDASPSVSRWRARLEVQRDIQRDYRRLTRDGITLRWPSGALSDVQADQVLAAVDRGLDDAAAFTGTLRRKQLTVVVYPSRSELLAVSCVRAWTAALFDGTLRAVAPPADGTFDWKVLRHETLHAQLSPWAPLAPKWFHEGVAQAFEQRPLPRRKWTQMVKSRTWVPFTSLDGSFQVFDSDNDADLAYAQSYGMVELMRDLAGDRAIATAVAAFQAGADTPAALARACNRSEVTGSDLLAFLERRLAQRP